MKHSARVCCWRVASLLVCMSHRQGHCPQGQGRVFHASGRSNALAQQGWELSGCPINTAGWLSHPCRLRFFTPFCHRPGLPASLWPDLLTCLHQAHSSLRPSLGSGSEMGHGGSLRRAKALVRRTRHWPGNCPPQHRRTKNRPPGPGLPPSVLRVTRGTHQTVRQGKA